MTTTSNRRALDRVLPALALAFQIGLAPASAYAAPPTPQEREEAKRAYAEARKLAQENKPVEALAMFRRAHELAPTPVTRLDLARALAGQGQLIEAQRLATTTAEMPVTATETQKSKLARKEAIELAAALAARIPKVVIAVTGGGDETEVAIDGTPLSKELLGSEVPLDPGKHEVMATAGERGTLHPFSLEEGQRLEIPLQIPQPKPPAEPPPPVAPVKPPPKVAPPRPAPPRDAATTEDDGVHPLVPVMLTVGGVSLLTGAITGAIALSQADDLLTACGEGGRCPSRLRDDLSVHHALTTTSTITFIVGGVATGAGVVGWIIDAASTPSAPAKVQARFTGTGIALEGTW